MIRYFPMPYPDESIYSIFAIYDKQTGNNNYYVTVEELLGNRDFNVDFSFAKGLDFLCDNLPENSIYTLEYFINNHTPLTIYKPFIPNSRYIKAIDGFKGGVRTSVQSAIGNLGGRLCKSDGFKYCPKCIEHDKSEYGEAYIHRLHQVEGNFVCIKHNCFLLEYKSLINRKYGFNDIEKVQLNITADKGLDYITKELYNLSKDLEFLLLNPELFNKYENTKEKYYSKMADSGYILPGGQIDQTRLHNDFLKNYSSEFLRKLESYVSIDQENNWLRNITKRKNRTIKPIRNLILIRFLFGGLEEFIGYSGSIKSSNISVKKGKRYSNEVYARLKVSYRKLIEEEIGKVTNITRSELRNRHTEAYRYIQNCDSLWLENILQSASIPKLSYNNNHIDWEKRDSETYKKVLEAINDVKNNEIPYRITKNWISETIHYTHIRFHLPKLPKTKKLIDDSIEELTDFHKRKIKISIKQLIKEKSKITPITILRKANINDKHRYNYDKFLEELLSENAEKISETL